MNPSTLGHLISARRIERNLTQAQLGRRLGLDQSRVSQYERGEKIPSKHLKQLYDVLGINPAEVEQ
ncbi:helix-turn-helix domain-containing protein [Nonomuraea sp. CA-141351]|uniref:helix-turn-helix domain-containing protein n=1 Tax=Nonomuraea sp. CA-141351 TaxID=3239996 RepID=UPI003D8E7365